MIPPRKIYLPFNVYKTVKPTEFFDQNERPAKSVDLFLYIQEVIGIDPFGDPTLVLNQLGNWISAGGGTVTLLENQIAFGDSNDEVTSSARLTYNPTTRTFDINFPSNNGSRLLLSDSSQIFSIDVNNTGGAGIYVEDSTLTSTLGYGLVQDASLCSVEVNNTSKRINIGNNGGTGNNTILVVDDDNERYQLTKLGGSGAGYVAVDNNGILSWSAGSGGTVTLTENQVAYGDSSNEVTSDNQFTRDTVTKNTIISASDSNGTSTVSVLNSNLDIRRLDVGSNLSRISILDSGTLGLSGNNSLNQATSVTITPNELTIDASDPGNFQNNILISPTEISFRGLVGNIFNYKFPLNDGALGETIINDGFGNLSWGNASTGWGLTGNAGTDPNTNFLGTTDSAALIIQPGESSFVGIGTITPAVKLDVDGSIIFRHTNSAYPSGYFSGDVIDGIIHLGDFSTDVNGTVITLNDTDQTIVIPNGNVGIGTPIPTAKLSIIGTFSQSVTDVDSNTMVNSTADSFTVQTSDGGTNEATSIALETNQASIGWGDGATSTNSILLNQDGILLNPSVNDGNVGIGTTSPTSKLTIDEGDVEILDSTRGIILVSPDNTRWRITVNDSGNLDVIAV